VPADLQYTPLTEAPELAKARLLLTKPAAHPAALGGFGPRVGACESVAALGNQAEMRDSGRAVPVGTRPAAVLSSGCS